MTAKMAVPVVRLDIREIGLFVCCGFSEHFAVKSFLRADFTKANWALRPIDTIGLINPAYTLLCISDGFNSIRGVGLRDMRKPSEGEKNH